MQTTSLEARYTSGVYAKRDLVIVSGQGALLYDEQGRKYIDCVGGQGAANIGHAHPAIAEAISKQAHKLISCPEIFYNDQRSQLISRLSEWGPPPGKWRVFLGNSGTEAVEAALKFARVSTQRTEFVAAMRAFHGRTFGALSATWNKKYRHGLSPFVPGFHHVPYNNLQRLAEAVNENTAGVLLEIVQGEGGVHPGSREFLQGAQAICRQHGALLIIDEVQTGFGRTGKRFALEHYGLQPDLICLAKSIAGGVPMGAVLIGDALGTLPLGIHGSTFGGNPLACAAALATLEVIDNQKLVERAASLGQYFLEHLKAIDSPLIREVRGMGLMLGIEIKQKVAPYLQALTQRGVLALPAGMTVIRLLPPLVITREQIEQVVQALDEVLSG